MSGTAGEPRRKQKSGPTPATGLSRPVAGFRGRLLLAMMLVVTAVTAVTLYLAERNLRADIETELKGEFQSELAGLRQAEAVRRAALVERCRALVRKPRIHAALEDGALDLLYPSAEDELRDIMAAGNEPAGSAATLRAQFYRFLDGQGQVISPPARAPIGQVVVGSEAQLALGRLNDEPQIGFLVTPGRPDAAATEIIATPIISTDSGDPIAALVLGFRPLELSGGHEMRSGVWTRGALSMPGVPAPIAAAVADAMRQGEAAADESRRILVGAEPYYLFSHRLNEGSSYPAAVGLSVFPVAQFATRQRELRLQIAGMGLLLLIAAFAASHVVAGRLSAPVEKLAIDSERSARFSADASHQLKTPVTVLRAGLEELQAREHLTTEDVHALAALIHQTYRLSSLIEDLLLLSRMDSGRLQLTLDEVDLGHLIAAAIDDLEAIPDAMGIEVQTELPAVLHVRGERRYTAIILQNLLENARKYNRAGGTIRIAAKEATGMVLLRVGNTGRPIPATAQGRIFERFHRGAMGENVPGYGLGLNLARELARLHGGDLRLVESAGDWTEFEVQFKLAGADRTIV